MKLSLAVRQTSEPQAFSRNLEAYLLGDTTQRVIRGATLASREPAMPDVPILALMVHDSDDQVFAAICAGASGYPLKNTPPGRLLESLTEVASDGAPMSPEIARRVVELFREFRPPVHADYRLTPQESTLLRLLVDGRHRKTAAKATGISVNTLSFHLKNIYEKLQVHSKTDAIAKALLERLL